MLVADRPKSLLTGGIPKLNMHIAIPDNERAASHLNTYRRKALIQRLIFEQSVEDAGFAGGHIADEYDFDNVFHGRL